MSTAKNTITAAHDEPYRKRLSFTFADFFCFLSSSLILVQFNLVGVMNATDIILLLAFLYLGLMGKLRVQSERGRKVLILGAFWLASQVVTDLIRHSPFSDYARGWSNIGLTLINFCVLMTLLYRKPRRQMMFGAGLATSPIVFYFLAPNEGGWALAWKFSLAYPLAMFTAIWASRRDCKGNTPAVLLAILGFITLIFGARSAGAICIAAAVYLAMNRHIYKKVSRGIKVKTSFILMMVVVFALGGAGVFSLYSYVGSKGYLGDDELDKYQKQTSGKYGLLLGGRFELLSTIPAIIDSPIIGHGSWARDPKYVIIMRQALILMNYNNALEMSPEELTEGLIPTHSFILGAWVYGGVLGAVFWLWIWIMTIKSLLRVYPPSANLLPLLAYVGFVMIWDILFSPFGSARRAQVPYYLVIIISYYDLAESSASNLAATLAKRMLKPSVGLGR